MLDLQPRRFFRQAMLITLLNPKAIVFYMAFFPLFVDPARHQGLATFGAMRASPRTAVWLNRIAGTMLVGFGVKLAVGK